MRHRDRTGSVTPTPTATRLTWCRARRSVRGSRQPTGRRCSARWRATASPRRRTAGPGRRNIGARRRHEVSAAGRPAPRARDHRQRRVPVRRRRPRPRARFTDLAGNLQTAARELGATADPGLPRFAQSSSTPPTSPRSARSGRGTRIHPRPAGRVHRHPRSAAAEPGAGVPRARRFGDGAAPAAHRTCSSSRCRRTSHRRASPRPSQPVAGSLTSRRVAGGSLTPKATNW